MDVRKFTLVLVAAAGLLPSIAQAMEPITVFKSASCGCCVAWMKHLEANGFKAAGKNLPSAALMQKKREAGLKPEHSSCHTGQIAGYVLEGHVPAREIHRLLSERPDAVGLAVPDMPLGSPGMETDGEKDPYDVLLVKRDGTTEVFASYHK